MRCQTVTHEGKKYFMPYCWGGVVHGPDYCTCYPPKKKKPKPEELNHMDIINMLHSAFRNAQGFEFGDDFVKIFDVETGKHWKITINEETGKAKKPKIKTVDASEHTKTVKSTSKETDRLKRIINAS